MHDVHAIAAALAQLRPLDEPALLATLVAVDGSSYRRPGARLLVTRAGKRVGAISGGCLEKHVARHGWGLTGRQRAALLTYDTRAADDAFWSAASGCDGKLQVLVERILPNDPPHAVETIARIRAGGRTCTAATLYQCHGEFVAGNGAVGQACVVDDAGVVQGAAEHFAAHGLLPLVTRSDALAAHKNLLVQMPQGSVRLLLEHIAPAPTLVVFGGGPDAVALGRAVKALHWHVTIVLQASESSGGDFPLADEVARFDSSQSGTGGGKQLNAASFCALMTHSYVADLGALRAALAANCQYVGVLGPARRTAQMLDDLSAEGLNISDAHRASLHGPVGLDVGAETSEEIAAAIVAEMLAVKSGRCGTALRTRARPIHPPDKLQSVRVGPITDYANIAD